MLTHLLTSPLFAPIIVTIVTGIVTAAGLALMFFFLVIVFAIIKKFTVDFVVPIMFLRQHRCLPAWKELGSLISGHGGAFVLYFLFQIVLAMAIGVIVFGAVIVTCCIAGCLMALAKKSSCRWCPNTSATPTRASTAACSARCPR